MLPFDSRDLPGMKTSRRGTMTSSRIPDYLRRVCDYKQMDFDFTFSQMITLLSLSPQNVYTTFYYRKQTKNQWARDDPAFVVVLTIFVAIASLAFAIVFCPANFWSYLWSVLYAVLIDWLLLGAIIATANW